MEVHLLLFLEVCKIPYDTERDKPKVAFVPKTSSICSASLPHDGQTDRQTDRQTLDHSTYCTMQMQRSVPTRRPASADRTARSQLQAILANQWADRRQVTQWRHGCRAMRRSVCNAGDSNAGRSLCVQISRERSYPLPIYWHHSKGNSLRYNFAAESFYIMKLCSRLFVLYCRNCPKYDKFR